MKFKYISFFFSNIEVLIRFSFVKDFRKSSKSVADLRFAHYRFMRTVGEDDSDISDWRLKFVYYFPLKDRLNSPPTK